MTIQVYNIHIMPATHVCSCFWKDSAQLCLFFWKDSAQLQHGNYLLEFFEYTDATLNGIGKDVNFKQTKYSKPRLSRIQMVFCPSYTKIRL